MKLDKLFAYELEMGLARGKDMVDRLLDGEEISVGPFLIEQAEALAQRINQLGADCVVEQSSTQRGSE